MWFVHVRVAPSAHLSFHSSTFGPTSDFIQLPMRKVDRDPNVEFKLSVCALLLMHITSIYRSFIVVVVVVVVVVVRCRYM